MIDNSILEPLKCYNSSLEEKFRQEALKYFDDLLKQSHTDEPLNKESVKKYKKAKAEADSEKDRLGTVKGLRIFLIFLMVAGFGIGILFILFAFAENANLALDLPLGIGGIILGVAMILVIFLKVNKVIKDREAKHQKLLDKANKLLAICYSQTAELCSIFDWNIPQKIVRKAAPLIQIDDYLDVKKFDMLRSKYGFGDILDPDTSTEMVVSGTVVGNPFLIVRNLHKFNSTRTYTGSLLITWTERVTDSEGHTSYVTRTQTLYASVTKPCPDYERLTYLVYGNDAAPNLSFSRSPSGLIHPDEKAVDRFVRKKEKTLEDYAEDAVRDNRTFTPMANVDFETMWGGWNRDHEVEYRLLFTALAQQNEISLITDPHHFGDDFHFEKRKCLNFITSRHSQNADYDVDPLSFVSYDVREIRDNFMFKVTKYFENLYFDLAPLLSIPLYQQQKPIEYIYKDNYPTNFTSYENEVMANSMPVSYFAHPQSETQCILKSTGVTKSGKTDKIVITSHSYYTEPRTDFVPVMGGDGHLHNVPVPWKEYFPIEHKQLMAMKAYETTRKGFDESLANLQQNFFKNNTASDQIKFKRGLLGFLINEQFDEEDDKELEKAFGFNKEN